MDDYYIDDWGEVQHKENLSDWSDFEPWQFWQTQFEWIDCDDDLKEQDVIAFRDDVIINHRDGSRTFKDGVRFNICRIANIKNEKAYLEVIHSEGEAAFENEERIYRSLKWLGRYGVQRWPRDHSPTERVTSEQKQKGDKIKQKREANSASDSATGSGSYTHTFNSKQRKKKHPQSRFYGSSPTGKNCPLKP
tara:strand:- start:20293 stop:20868 length:576 start_codon:yes stop_codon:yes gene_type:complete